MKKVLFIGLMAFATLCAKISAQEITPCSEQLSTEIRKEGTGSGSNAFEALTNAVNNAMSNVKADITVMFPGKNFEYSILSKHTAEGEEIELETTLGQPNICHEEINCDSSENCKVTIVLNFDISVWQNE